MALSPLNPAHALQIQAGILGRNAGHSFEDRIAAEVAALSYPLRAPAKSPPHVATGNPAQLLVEYVAVKEGISVVTCATAISTGALATSEDGKQWLSINGSTISRCKSDLVLTIEAKSRPPLTLGVSTKQCNNKTPTNAQLYFTTSRGFATLLTANGIPVSPTAVAALRQFCGDAGFRPLDSEPAMRGRQTDPRRYFWEEIGADGRQEWETLLSDHQDEITRLLLQKAYIDDPFVPEYLIHKTKRAANWLSTEVAIYSIAELVALSHRYQGFATKPYSVRKGSHKDPAGVSHLAPRFGIVQMQRGGQAQHPEQLQFNLEAGYFYKL